MQHFVRMAADAAKQAEAGLDEQWSLDEAFFPEIVKIVQVGGEAPIFVKRRAMQVQVDKAC
jgi:hypothetical protein